MKFNKADSKSTKTVNRAGGLAYSTDKKTELFLRCASYLYGEDKFYATGSKLNKELMLLTHDVLKEDPEFVLKLAYYCRTKLNLRTLPMVLLVEYANSDSVGSVSGARKYISSTIQRADELTEILAYQLRRNKDFPRKTKIPMVIKYGVSDAFNKFDAYQMAKYDKINASVTMKDAILLTHPKAVDIKQGELFKSIIDGNIQSPHTWEVVLSNWKEKFATKKEAWESVVSDMGIMALTRNLRNLMIEGVDPTIYVDKFKNKNDIKNSRMFPFRFYSAYKEVESVDIYMKPYNKEKVLEALETAMDISVDNLPKIEGSTCVMVDLSGSMEHRLSGKSKVTYRDISSLMGSVVNAMSDKSVVIGFADFVQIIPLHKRNGVLTNSDIINMSDVGGATYAYKAFEIMLSHKIKVDRIVMLSDMQCYEEGFATKQNVNGLLQQYRKNINPDVYMYSVDLSGYGTVIFPKEQSKNVLMAGWSEKVFQFINTFERDRVQQIDEVKNILIL